jgi:hypothetical protein
VVRGGRAAGENKLGHGQLAGDVDVITLRGRRMDGQDLEGQAERKTTQIFFREKTDGFDLGVRSVAHLQHRIFALDVM